MSVSVIIDGLDKMIAVCDPQRFVAEVDRAVFISATHIRDITKQIPPVSAKRTGYAALGIPVDTGLMRQRLISRKNGVMDASVTAETDYSKMVHDGTSRMPARPFFTWTLQNFGGLESIELLISAALQRVVTP